MNEDAIIAWREEIGIARHSTLSPDVLKSIALDVRDNGMPAKSAAEAAGVNYETFKNWQKQYPWIRDLILAAKAQWQRKTFIKLQKTADQDPKYWASRAWSLERTDPETWAQKKPDEGETPRLVVQIGSVENLDINALLNSARPRESGVPVLDSEPVESPKHLPSGDTQTS